MSLTSVPVQHDWYSPRHEELYEQFLERLSQKPPLSSRYVLYQNIRDLVDCDRACFAHGLMEHLGSVFRRHEIPREMIGEGGGLHGKVTRLWRWDRNIPIEDLPKLMDVLSKAPPDRLWQVNYQRPFADRSLRVIYGSYGNWYVAVAFFGLKVP